jgi:hypothetical protein
MISSSIMINIKSLHLVFESDKEACERLEEREPERGVEEEDEHKGHPQRREQKQVQACKRAKRDRKEEDVRGLSVCLFRLLLGRVSCIRLDHVAATLCVQHRAHKTPHALRCVALRCHWGVCRVCVHAAWSTGHG